jgi:hypothetical protein
MQYQRQRLPWGGYAILLLLVLAIFFVLSNVYKQQFNSLFSSFEPSCSMRGYGATITVQAWSANDDCEAMIYGQDNFTGVIWHNMTATTVVDGDVACEMDMNGRHVIVRGNGIVCDMFHPYRPIGD